MIKEPSVTPSLDEWKMPVNPHRIYGRKMLVTPDKYGNRHMALVQYDRVYPGKIPDHLITKEEMAEILKM